MESAKKPSDDEFSAEEKEIKEIIPCTDEQVKEISALFKKKISKPLNLTEEKFKEYSEKELSSSINEIDGVEKEYLDKILLMEEINNQRENLIEKRFCEKRFTSLKWKEVIYLAIAGVISVLGVGALAYFAIKDFNSNSMDENFWQFIIARSIPFIFVEIISFHLFAIAKSIREKKQYLLNDNMSVILG
jgi:hypothetical protein